MTDSVESVPQKSREKFEKWAESKAYDLRRCSNPHCKDGADHYREGSGMNAMWHAWQARSALEPMLAELDRWKALYYEQEEEICSCNLPPDRPDLHYVCEWHKKYPKHAKAADHVIGLAQRAEAAEQALREARAWKDSATSVLNGIDLQAVAKQLGLPLGSDIGPAILPAIKRLQDQRHNDCVLVSCAGVGKLAELKKELTNSAFPCNRPERLVLHLETVIEALDEMALRVFEDTRERAAKLAENTYAKPGWHSISAKTAAPEIAEAIRAMQPEAGTGK